MGKRYVSAEAECPFYRSEGEQKIYCEGVQEGTSIHLAFGSKTDTVRYRNSRCCDKFQHCLIFKALLKKY